MDALTQLVLLVTLAAVALYALYWTVRRAIRDELTSTGGRDDPPAGGPGT
ncbi:hypothetical protein [Microbacterium sp. Leaf151]|nr:hypothetical protein [Microbacterium sp. Leaf151]